uniref:Peptidase M24 domain-containing protein n=1 Tax=Arundo donax TaxID=35708 RepID=A0A0A9DQ73_ARUDO
MHFCEQSHLSYVTNGSDDTVLAEDNVVKINTAIHIDGFIAAAAHTLLISDKPIPNRTADVIGAAEIAGESMLKRVKAGTKLLIAKLCIFSAISSRSFKLERNLC